MPRKKKGLAGTDLMLQLASLLNGLEIKRVRGKLVLKEIAKVKKREPTPAQEARRIEMAYAVAFAREINSDPAERAKWKKRAKGYTNVYQAAVSWYLKNGGDGQD